MVSPLSQTGQGFMRRRVVISRSEIRQPPRQQERAWSQGPGEHEGGYGRRRSESRKICRPEQTASGRPRRKWRDEQGDESRAAERRADVLDIPPAQFASQYAFVHE